MSANTAGTIPENQGFYDIKQAIRSPPYGPNTEKSG